MKNAAQSTLLLILGLLILSSICNDNETGDTLFENVTVIEAHQLIQDNANNPDFIILDVRTQSEFAGGHIENAVNIDFNAEDFRDQLDALDKENIYLVYCRSGNRSGQAMDIMRDLEFRRVYNMLGGINDWIDAGYDVVT